MKVLLTLLLVCFGMGVASAQAKSVEYYRYVSEDGIPVISNTIPPELVYKGYSIVNEEGTVLRVVLPQLTPAEVEARDRKAKEDKAAEESRVTRAHEDAELRKLYATPRDVEEARDRKMLSFETAIATTRLNVEQLKLKKQHLEEQAAQREREGLAPSADILDNLKILETQIGGKESEVAARKVEQQRVSDQFAFDLDRIKLLYGVAPVDATPTDAAR